MEAPKCGIYACPNEGKYPISLAPGITSSAQGVTAICDKHQEWLSIGMVRAYSIGGPQPTVTPLSDCGKCGYPVVLADRAWPWWRNGRQLCYACFLTTQVKSEPNQGEV
jgi:hypothetical protein